MIILKIVPLVLNRNIFRMVRSTSMDFLLQKKKSGRNIYMQHRKARNQKFLQEKVRYFHFPANGEKKEMIAEAVAANQLFFSIVCVMNYQPCISAMKWFREYVYFSKDYADIPRQLLEHAENANMLKSIVTYAKQADVGIEDMSFEIRNEEISAVEALSDNLSEGMVMALKQFVPCIEQVLQQGGVLMVDEIDRELHPLLAEFIISKFQSIETNLGYAQIIFTTHDTELLNMEILRKDQVYFVDKNKKTECLSYLI